MESILEGLNAAQHAAVTSPFDVLQILAPPGSGKTKTLTSRVAYLLAHHGYKPWDILCLTFTIKSSREMRERIAKLIGNGMEARMILGTFHSVCRRYLVSYGHLIGLRKGFGIADSSDSSSIIKRIIKRLKFNIEPRKAQSRISSSKSRGIGYAELAQEAAKKKNIDNEEFACVFEAYEHQLEKSNLLDYDDLLLRCVDLLRQHPTCVSNVEVVLIDEFQDTNLVQFDLMRLFAAKRKRVTTVGDPDQSIYGWRSAEIKNLARMRKQYPDTLVIRLEDNYRSSGAILLAAREVIEQDESRVPRPLLPTHCPGTVPVLRRLPSAEIEASWIVSEIRRSSGMTGGMLAYSDFAILLRSASLSRTIESAMGKAGLPYRMVGGQRFFDRTEIKILLDYLRVVSQPDNNDALVRIVNVPPRGLGVTTMKALLEEAETKGRSMWSFSRDVVQGHTITKTRISRPAEQRLSSFINLILTARRKLIDTTTNFSLSELLQYVLKKLEFQEYLKKAHELDHEARWANVEELLAQASDCTQPKGEITMDSEHGVDLLPQIEGLEQKQGNAAEEALSMFLANVALATELQREDESEEGETTKACITISTIHAAKGLEWPVVFIPSTYEGSLPHSRAEDTNEERRLLYVAMTRAQALLYMSCPTKNSQREETTLSHFLNSRNVSQYLVNKGPTLDLSTVNDIARILRRDCPMESHIIEGCRTVENTQDDLWPLDGTEDQDASHARWNKWNENTYAKPQLPMVKRRKTTHNEAEERRHPYANGIAISNIACSIGTATTMQNSSAFTQHRVGGFVSAAVQLQHFEQGQLETQSVRGTSKRKGAISVGIRDERLSPAIPGDRTKANNLLDSQGTLTGFFSKRISHHVPRYGKANPVTAMDSETAVNHSNIQESYRDRDLVRQSMAYRAQVVTHLGETHYASSRKPPATIPSALGHHKLQPVSNISRPCLPAAEKRHSSKQYVFLSSSPPPPEDISDNAERRREEQPHSIIIGGRAQLDLQVQGNNNNVRPAATFHTTSVAQSQAAPNIYKKTLGVRRSMAGWANRANK